MILSRQPGLIRSVHVHRAQAGNAGMTKIEDELSVIRLVTTRTGESDAKA
jgi:hypothetical protein